MCNSCLASLCGLALALSVVAGEPPKGDPPAKVKAKDNKSEVHLVGIYEGYTKTDGMIHGGKAHVSINRPGKSVMLVLVSHNSVTWEVAVNKDTKLEKVILGGSKRTAVIGLPEKVTVVEAFRTSKTPLLPFATYKIDDPSFRTIVETLHGLTGQDIASFAGVYRAEADILLSVEEVGSDERYSVEYPKPISASKLPKLSFQAHHILGKSPHEATRAFGEFTLSGPKKDTLVPLPKHVSRIAYNPASKKYYGIYQNKLAEIDIENSKPTTIETGLKVPEISWPADVTFDTKRERVLLTTFGGGGYLYAYTPKTNTWEVLAEKPAQVIAYHTKNDTLYGLRCDFGGKTELQEINAKGAIVTSTALDGQFLPGVLGDGTNGARQTRVDDCAFWASRQRNTNLEVGVHIPHRPEDRQSGVGLEREVREVAAKPPEKIGRLFKTFSARSYAGPLLNASTLKEPRDRHFSNICGCRSGR